MESEQNQSLICSPGVGLFIAHLSIAMLTTKEVLEELAPELLKTRIYHMILEANASEHSARRMAMKNASENATELSGNLNVVYNKSRQASITREIIEVTSGAQSSQ